MRLGTLFGLLVIWTLTLLTLSFPLDNAAVSTTLAAHEQFLADHYQPQHQQYQYRYHQPHRHYQPPSLSAREMYFYKFLGSIGGSIQTMTFDGSWVYVGQGGALLIFDCNTPTTPVARIPLTDYIQHIAIADDLAYVALGNSGVHILDISTPTVPKERGHITLQGSTSSVHVQGNYAYVTTTGFEGGLRVVDISNADTPLLLGSISTMELGSSAAVDVDSTSQLAYVATGRGRSLQVIDVSNPVSPTIIGAFMADTPIHDVQLDGPVAYLAADSDGLLVLDVSTPTAPQRIGQTALPGKARAVWITQDVVAVAADVNGFSIVGISTPSQPKIVGSYDVIGETAMVLQQPNTERFWVAANSGGMQVFDLSEPLTPTLESHYTTLYGAVDVVVADDHQRAYVAAGNAGMAIVTLTATPPLTNTQSTQSSASITASNTFTVVSQVTLAGSAQALAIADDTVYIAADREGVQMVNVSDPLSPTLISSLAVPGRVTDIQVREGRAYVAAGSAGVHVLDVSSPVSPTLVGSVDTAGSALALQVSGDMAYVADQHSLLVLDVRDATNPSIRGQLAMEEQVYTRGLVVVSDTVYLAAGGVGGGMRIIDVRDATNPVLLGMTTDAAIALDVYDTLAYVATVSEGMQLVDVQDASNPVVLSSTNTPGIPQSVWVADDRVFVADFSSGLLVLGIVPAKATVFLPLVVSPPSPSPIGRQPSPPAPSPIKGDNPLPLPPLP